MPRLPFLRVLPLVFFAGVLRADTPKAPPAAPEMVSGPAIHLDGVSPASERTNKKGAPRAPRKKPPVPADGKKQAPPAQVASAPAK